MKLVLDMQAEVLLEWGGHCIWAWGRGFGAARMSTPSLPVILEGQEEVYRDKFGVVLSIKLRPEWGDHSGTSLLVRPPSVGVRTIS